MKFITYPQTSTIVPILVYLSLQPHTIALPATHRVSDEGDVEDKGILITADVDISVQIGLFTLSGAAAAFKV